jgi:hypothetical protein
VLVRRLAGLGFLVLALAAPLSASARQVAVRTEGTDTVPLFRADVSEALYAIVFEELLRDADLSRVKVEIRRTASAEASLWITCQVAELAKSRGFAYHVLLAVVEETPPPPGQQFPMAVTMDVGFVDSADADLTEVFGLASPEDALGRAVHVEENAETCAPLLPAAPEVSELPGEYELRLTIGNSCRQLPSNERDKVYDATILQVDRQLHVVLGGADFLDRPELGPLNTFWGQVSDGTAYFWLENTEDVERGIVEVLESGLNMEINGLAQVALGETGLIETLRDGSGVQGWLAGEVRIGRDVEDPLGLVRCSASDHWFQLRRRR